MTSIETPEIEAYVYKPAFAMGWRYGGVKSGPTNTAHRDPIFGGIASYTSHVQAQFQACPWRIGCAGEVNPWIRVNSYRDGSSTAAAIG